MKVFQNPLLVPQERHMHYTRHLNSPGFLTHIKPRSLNRTGWVARTGLTCHGGTSSSSACNQLFGFNGFNSNHLQLESVCGCLQSSPGRLVLVSIEPHVVDRPNWVRNRTSSGILFEDRPPTALANSLFITKGEESNSSEG